MRRLLLTLIALVALACGNDARPDFIIHMVEGRIGGNPFTSTGCISGTIRIDVAQGTEDVITQNGTFADGDPNVGVQVPSYGLLTQLHVTVNCTVGTFRSLIGSTPEFIPTGYGFVDIVLSAPGTTVPLSTPTLVPTRAAPQLVALGANVLVVGGRIDAAGMATPLIQRLDPVQLTHPEIPGALDAFPTAVGLGTSLPFTSTSFLFVSNVTYGIYDATPGVDPTTRVSTPFALPTSAGPDSAVITLVDGSGIAVVGGSIGGDASADITWIAADGLSTATGMLSYPRLRPAVAMVGGKLLVAGGQAAGSPLFELVAVRGADAGIPFDPPGAAGEQRYAPVLTTDLNHQFAFVALGSTDPEDQTTLSTTTYVLSHCQTTGASPGCTVTGSDPWPDAPRADFATIAHHVGTTMNADDYETLVIGGRDASGAASMLLDRIHVGIDGSVAVTIAASAEAMLSTPRAQPGVADIGGGIVLVAGGADTTGNPLGTIELCYPEFLAPISSITP